MKKVIIDAANFKDKKQMFTHLHAVLGNGNFEGNNLDALHDCLTMIFEPTEITVRNYANAKVHLGGYADIFWHVLDDASEENKNLRIVID